MNSLQISEIERRAKIKSEYEHGERIYVLIKPDACLAEITKNIRVAKSRIIFDKYSLHAIFKDGRKVGNAL